MLEGLIVVESQILDRTVKCAVNHSTTIECPLESFCDHAIGKPLDAVDNLAEYFDIELGPPIAIPQTPSYEVLVACYKHGRPCGTSRTLLSPPLPPRV